MHVHVASVGGCTAPAHHIKAPSLGFCLYVWCSPNDLCYRLPGRRKAMKGRLYFTTKAQKEGKIMIKTHPCARIFCCHFCGFDEVGGCRQGCKAAHLHNGQGRAWQLTPAPAWCTTQPWLLPQVDAEQYYGELEEKLTDEFNAERNRITLKRLDMAFVTFQDERMTAV